MVLLVYSRAYRRHRSAYQAWEVQRPPQTKGRKLRWSLRIWCNKRSFLTFEYSQNPFGVGTRQWIFLSPLEAKLMRTDSPSRLTGSRALGFHCARLEQSCCQAKWSSADGLGTQDPPAAGACCGACRICDCDCNCDRGG